MTCLRNLLICLGLILLAACSDVDVLNATVPKDGYQVTHDIRFGKHSRQQLDVYVPNKLSEPAPTILFFYGGSWQHGKKEDYLFAAEAFASLGYVVVVADYRLYPDHYFPDFMNDAASALAWMHKHIAEYEGDPNRIFVAGHSAGAYIAVMLAVNDQYIKQAGGTRGWIRGVIGMAGPYDFLPITDPEVKKIFSKRPENESQPIHFVASGMPPMLLATGDADDQVLPENTVHMAAALRRKGNVVEEYHYPDVAHIGIVLSLNHLFRTKTPLMEQADHFIRSH